MKETVEIAAGWTWDELCHLGTELHDPGEDYLSASEWAAHFGKGRRTVDRVLRELEARGMVDKAYRDAYRKDGSVYGIPVYRIHPKEST